MAELTEQITPKWIKVRVGQSEVEMGEDAVAVALKGLWLVEQIQVRFPEASPDQVAALIEAIFPPTGKALFSPQGEHTINLEELCRPLL